MKRPLPLGLLALLVGAATLATAGSVFAKSEATTADLTIATTQAPNTATTGSQIQYVLTVVNNGPDAISNAQVIDTLPAGTTFVSATAGCTKSPAGGTGGTVTCSNLALASGGSLQITITVTAPASVPNTNNGKITNSAQVTASGNTDMNTANNQANYVTTITSGANPPPPPPPGPPPPPPQADLSVTKTDSPDPVAAGSNLTYTISMHNNSASTAATGVAVTDPIPAGTTFVSFSSPLCSLNGATVQCPIGTIAAGATVNLTIVVKPNQGPSVTNTASVTAANAATKTATATTAVTAAAADLELLKSVSPSTVLVGQDLTYKLTVTNHGPNTAQGVTVTDPIPSTYNFKLVDATQGTCNFDSGQHILTCNLGLIGSGDTVVITIVVTSSAVGNFQNSATVAASTPDPNTANNTGTISSTVSSGAPPPPPPPPPSPPPSPPAPPAPPSPAPPSPAPPPPSPPPSPPPASPPPASPPPPSPPPAGGTGGITLPTVTLLRGLSHSPKFPVAGKPFTAAVRVSTNRLAGLLANGKLACTARIGRKPVKVKAKLLSRALAASGAAKATVTARCTWSVPKHTSRKILKGSISVRWAGRTPTRHFTFKIR